VDLNETIKMAFDDELAKIAGGWSRAGKTPFKMSTLAKKALMTKVSSHPFKNLDKRTKELLTAAAAGGAASVVAVHKGKRAIDDYRMGRAIRKQQQG
jgi:hypothetical protein